MKLAYFDCLSGISGNMVLGAMLACGLDKTTLLNGLAQLNLDEWAITTEQVLKRGISATWVNVDVHGHHGLQHPHRGLDDILHLINSSRLSHNVKETASAIFQRLGEAEAAVHGTTTNKVHFHEVGAVDAIVDIVGTAIGLDALGIDKVVCSPLPLGKGWITCAHGEFPVPAPATALLVRGVPIVETNIEAELVTPTGAAIVTTVAERFGTMPAMTFEVVGYGAGHRELPRPNVLRLFIGSEILEEAPETVIGLETNIDDLPGEVLGYLMDRLFAAGALDVFFTPIQMKKNRPGVLVSVLCAPQDETTFLDILFSETTTLGVRRQLYNRTILPREIRNVETQFGPVRVKVSRWGDVERFEPEYEDCRQLAEQHGVPLLHVYNAARNVR